MLSKERGCDKRNLSSRSRVEPTHTLTSVLFFSSEQIIVVQEWLPESNTLYLYPSNKCCTEITASTVFVWCVNELHYQILDPKIWTYRHQAVKASKKRNKVLLLLYYMRNVTCLHIVSHLRRSKIPTAPDVYIDAINKKCNTKRITQLVSKLQEQIVRTKVTFIIRHIFSMPLRIILYPMSSLNKYFSI